MKKNIVITFVSILALSALGWVYWAFLTKPSDAKPPMPVRIMWLEWGPADIVQELSKDFTAETGMPVIVEQLPTTRWQQVAYKEFDTQYPRFDLVGGDSQWIGYGAEKGFYVDLTDFIRENKIEGTFSELATKGYGEYPPGSGRYYAAPFGGNAIAYAYRTDWFADPVERAAFLTKYGYELKPPRTTNELRDIAEFFTRPAENKYGFVFGTGKTAYDPASMSFGTFLFAFGGAWGDRGRCVAEGYVNNKGAIDALEYLRGLYAFTPPGSQDLAFHEAAGKYMQGNVAVLSNPMTYFPTLTNPAKNPYASSTGYFASLFGPKSQYGQLAGQGISLLRDARNYEGAQKYIEWWIRKDTQEKFAKMGGFTMHREVIGSDWFKSAAPYNTAYSDSVELLEDYWNNPSYESLLKVSQKYLNAYITGSSTMNAKETLDTIVKEWNPILANECK